MSVTASWIAITGLMLAGSALVCLGLWPRRRGSTPHCPQCDYNFTGLTSDRCPECGTPATPASTVWGERHRSAVRVGAGVLCMAVASVLAVAVLREVDWYRFRPTAWVIADLQAGSSPLVTRAWNELDWRIKADRLSRSNQQKLIELGLKAQASSPRWPGSYAIERGLIDYLGQCYQRKRLSPAQRATFLKQLVTVVLSVRRVTCVGDNIPYLQYVDTRAPSNVFSMAAHIGYVLVDGKSLGGYGTCTPVGGSVHGGCFQCKTPGRHTLTSGIQVTIQDLPVKPDGSPPNLYTEPPVEVVFDVMPAGTDYIKHVSDPSITEAVQDCIHVDAIDVGHPVWSSNEKVHECGGIRIYTPPVDLALEVFVRTGGKEYFVRRLYRPKTGGTLLDPGLDDGFFARTYFGPMVEKADVVIRSSDAAARRTIAMQEIWQGELIYKDVPVLNTPAEPLVPTPGIPVTTRP